MVVRLPQDIEDLIVARVRSGEFASPEDVLRSAMAPWIAREQARIQAMAEIKSKIAEGDADDTEFSASAVRDHLDQLAAQLQRHDPNAA